MTESKLALLATQQADKSRDNLLGEGIATLFRKPADRKDGGLLSQRTISQIRIQASFILKGEGGLPWRSRLRLCLPMQGVRVQSLVGELRSHMPHSQKTKIQDKSNIATNAINTLKNGPHSKKKS